MMKKAFFMLAMLTCILAGCSGGGNDEPINPTPKPEEVKAEITLDSSIVSNGLSFGVASGEQIVSFSANTNWTLSVASTTSGATWCKASATSGSKGNATVKFTIDENTSYDDRSVSVTIKAGTASKTFTITQKGADALLVTTNKYEVAQEGGKIEVEVKANINYELAISETAKDWITESKSRALTTHKHTFEIALNEESEKREGEITFKSGDKVETVKVYQAGGAIILLSQNEYTVNDAGETISVDIKSNVEYGVQMPDVDWIADEVSSRGMSSHTLKYVISPNEGYDARSAEIIFYDKNSDLKDTLKVVQAQKDAIVISKKNISVDKEGGTIEVKLNTNVDFVVQIPSEATWITKTDSRALTEKSFYLKIAENTSNESRTTNITIINKDSQLNETVVVTQQGNITIVTLKEAGTLKSLLKDDYLKIKSLKIVGPINGDDVYYLRKMLGGSDFSEADWGKLTTLDLLEASIVEGGNWYYYYDSNIWEESDQECYTSNFAISDYMFYGCNNLLNIVLPHNTTSIGKRSFKNCKSLISIFIPESVTTMNKEAFYGCISLKEVEIANGGVGQSAFIGCNALERVTITKGVIGEDAFERCESLKEVTILEGEIGRSSFFYCEALTTLTLGKDITSINFFAFIGCDNLENIYYKSDINHWLKINVSEAFESGYNLYIENKLFTELVIPNDITEYNIYNLRGCKSLKKVTIHDSVISIGDYVFEGCSNLSTVIIGKNVEKVGQYAFGYTSITDCYSYATTPPNLSKSSGSYIYYKAFYPGVKEGAKLYVPARCGTEYKSSRWGEYFKNIIEMD